MNEGRKEGRNEARSDLSYSKFHIKIRLAMFLQKERPMNALNDVLFVGQILIN